MGVADLIRSETVSIRDYIANLETEIAQAEAKRDAAEERAKRASTEITRQRALEAERKRSLNAASDKAAEAGRVLEEAERKRQEALDSLYRCREEQRSLTQSLKEALTATEAALGQVRKEQENSQKTEAHLSKLRKEREGKESELRQAILQSLDFYLKQQAERVLSAFATQQERQELMRDYEALRRARHSDPDVARLCEQRDELTKFLSAANVLGVRETLQASLTSVEDQLRARFPGAFQLASAAPYESQIEELLFYSDKDGHAVFFIPVRAVDWEASQRDEPTDDGTKAMCVIWNMIRELGVKERDGDFVAVRGWPAFESILDIEEVAILQGFAVKHHSSDILRFVLMSVPIQVQEALLYEG